MAEVEVIDSAELAKRWLVPESWIRSKVRPSRTAAAQQIPHKQLGRYIRFEWGSPALAAWWARHDRGMKL